MKHQPLLGVNLYCFRDHCQTEADLDRTLGRLKAMGMPSVQISGLRAIPLSVVRSLLDKHGLVACAAHDSLDALKNPQEVAAKLKTLGCRFTALGFPGEEFLAKAKWNELKDILVNAGKVLAAAGLQLGYHNHDQEFEDQGGTKLLNWIYENTPADVLFAEPDTAWVQHGGGSPEAWIRKLAGRIPAVHLKDYTWTKNGVRLCEIGQGNLDWPGILKACVETKVPVWIIEQDHPVAERDHFASVEMSLNYLKTYLSQRDHS
jgi:sugar phosphate isomerase/epimerase